MESTLPLKRVVLICACSGVCPSMAKIDFWALAERVRLELGEEIEFIALHPRLCEPDGERLMSHILSKDMLFVTAACPEQRQAKLLRDGFAKANVPMDSEHWRPVSMAQETTEAVFEKIKSVLRSSSR